MSTKNTLVLLILAVALVGVAYWFNSREQSQAVAAAAPTRVILEGITSSTIERIEIAAPSAQPVALEKVDAVWYTDAAKKHRADKNLVNGVFGVIEKKIEGDVVSANPESFADFQVTDTSGTRVKLLGTGGKVIADLYIGKAGPSFTSTYVRPADAKEVVDAQATLSYLFNKPEGWRDKALMQIRADAIVGIRAEGTSATYELVKEGDKWQFKSPMTREGDATKLQPVLSTIATLRAVEFVDLPSTKPLSEIGLNPADQKLAVSYTETDGGKTTTVTRTLLVGKKSETGSGYYVKHEDSEDIAVISEYNGLQLRSAAADLAVTPPPAVPPAADAITTGAATTDTATTGAAATAPTDGATTPTVPQEAATTPAVSQDSAPTPTAPKDSATTSGA
jgi:hypothetical protein